MQTKQQALEKLKQSKFRSSFHLKKKEIQYVQEKGYPLIREHAQAFVKERLAPAEIINDGKQTPMKDHPIFIAQHACACCCRGCLNQWYHVPKHVELNVKQQEQIVNLLMYWIEEEMKQNNIGIDKKKVQ